MKLTRNPDAYINSIYQRLLNAMPKGSYYGTGEVLILPVLEGVAKIILETDHVGLRHVITSDLQGATFPVIADKSPKLLELRLPAGRQKLTVQAFDSDNNAVDNLELNVQVSNIATLQYSFSEITAPLWIDLIDLNAISISGTQLLSFETNLGLDIRKHLPEDFSSRSIALKYLLKAKNIGLSTDSLEAIIAAFCDINFPKMMKHENFEDLDGSRVVSEEYENNTSEIHLWLHSKGEARRAARARLVQNFPEVFESINNTNSGMIITRKEPDTQ